MMKKRVNSKDPITSVSQSTLLAVQGLKLNRDIPEGWKDDKFPHSKD